MKLGLSGTAGLGRSGTADSDYREHAIPGNPQKTARNRDPSNYPNREESFGFLLTADAPVDSSCGGAGQEALVIAPFGDDLTAVSDHVLLEMIVVDPTYGDRSHDRDRRTPNPLASIRTAIALPFARAPVAPASVPGERS